MRDVVWRYLTREQMREVHQEAETPGQPGSLFTGEIGVIGEIGEKILLYHEWSRADTNGPHKPGGGL
jgi:hypothetical protein